MSALFERAQKTVVMITSVPVTAAELDTATWLNLSCTIKQASFTAGQKNDIDVTVLCSDETENINGLLRLKCHFPVTSTATRRRMHFVQHTITTGFMDLRLFSRLVMDS